MAAEREVSEREFSTASDGPKVWSELCGEWACARIRSLGTGRDLVHHGRQLGRQPDAWEGRASGEDGAGRIVLRIRVGARRTGRSEAGIPASGGAALRPNAGPRGVIVVHADIILRKNFPG